MSIKTTRIVCKVLSNKLPVNAYLVLKQQELYIKRVVCKSG